MNGILIENGDLVLSGGSMSIGNVDEQLVEFVMVAAPGELKETPSLGMNIRTMLNGVVDPFFVGRLKTQLKTQHLDPKLVTISETDITVEV